MQDQNREGGFGAQGFVTDFQNLSVEHIALDTVTAAGHGWGGRPRFDRIGLALDPNGANFTVGFEEGIAGHNQVGVLAGGNGAKHRIHAEEPCGRCGQGGQGIVKRKAGGDGFANSGRECVHFVQTVGGESDGDAGFAKQSGIGRGLVPMDQGAQANATGLDGIAEIGNLREEQGQYDGATQGPYGVQVHVLLSASFVDKRTIELFGNSFSPKNIVFVVGNKELWKRRKTTYVVEVQVREIPAIPQASVPLFVVKGLAQQGNAAHQR